MATTTNTTSRTAHLLELMTKGDDAFNARDWDGRRRGPPPRHDRLHHRARRADLWRGSALRSDAASSSGVSPTCT